MTHGPHPRCIFFVSLAYETWRMTGVAPIVLADTYWLSEPPPPEEPDEEDTWWADLPLQGGYAMCAPCMEGSSSLEQSANVSQCLCGLGFSEPAWCQDGRCGPCLKCLPGTYTTDAVGNSQCTPCPPFTTSPFQASSVLQCECQVGYGLSNESCVLCPEGIHVFVTVMFLAFKAWICLFFFLFSLKSMLALCV